MSVCRGHEGGPRSKGIEGAVSGCDADTASVDRPERGWAAGSARVAHASGGLGHVAGEPAGGQPAAQPLHGDVEVVGGLGAQRRPCCSTSRLLASSSWRAATSASNCSSDDVGQVAHLGVPLAQRLLDPGGRRRAGRTWRSPGRAPAPRTRVVEVEDREPPSVPLEVAAVQVGVEHDRALPGVHLANRRRHRASASVDDVGVRRRGIGTAPSRRSSSWKSGLVEQRQARRRAARANPSAWSCSSAMVRPRAWACSSSHCPTSSPSSHDATVACSGPPHCGQSTATSHAAAGRRERVGHQHVGLGGEGVQPGLLGRDVGGRAVRVGVDPQGQAPPVVGVEPERRVVGVQHQREVAHAEAERRRRRPVRPAAAPRPGPPRRGRRTAAPSVIRYGDAPPPRHLALPDHAGVPRHGPGVARRGAGRRPRHLLARGPPERGRAHRPGPPRRHRGPEVLPAPWDVRSRVHEYGGGAYAVRHGTVVFSHVGDDRVHRLDAGAAEPVAITPAGPVAVRRARRSTATTCTPCARTTPASPSPPTSSCGSTCTATTPTAGWCSRPAATSSRGPRSPPTAGPSRGSRGSHPNMPWDSTRCCGPS